MSLLERARQDLTTAMKARDAARMQSLRLMIAELQKEVTSAKPADDLSVLRRIISRADEAEAAFRQGGADDRAETEALQRAVFQEYLPVQLSDEELESLVKEAVAETGADSPKQMGQVMKSVVPKVAGRAANGRISAAVKQALGG